MKNKPEKTVKEKKSFSLKKLKLATKTSVVIAFILTLSLSILIGSSVWSVSSELTKTIDGEFSGIATQNGLIVQAIIEIGRASCRERV